MPALEETTDAAPLGAGSAPSREDPRWPGLGPATASSGVPLDPEIIAQLLEYRDLLLEWNTRFNLTAIRDREAMERVLLLDAIRMLPTLDAVVADTGLRHPSLIDIGSGGGLPAIPIAICRPDIDLTMVEATGKKVRFLQEVITRLGLDRARALNARAEDLARTADNRERYDIATARAVASLPALIELTGPFLRVGGTGLFPKGMEIGPEIAAATIACREIGCELAGTEILRGDETTLVTIRKVSPTPSRYPRRSGLPAQQPLGGRGGAS